MNVNVSIGELVSVSVDDDTEPNLEALEFVLRRCGDAALRIHGALAGAPDETT